MSKIILDLTGAVSKQLEIDGGYAALIAATTVINVDGKVFSKGSHSVRIKTEGDEIVETVLSVYVPW